MGYLGFNFSRVAPSFSLFYVYLEQSLFKFFVRNSVDMIRQ